jgi:GST-like protein
MSTYRVFAKKGWGSCIAEATLELTGLPYEVVDLDFDTPGPDRDRLLAMNPLGQVPTLVLPDGTLMTESAAIVLHVADRVPSAGLVPAAADAARPTFLRWLIFLVAAVYPTFTYGDFPSRWVSGEAATKELRARTDAHRQDLWRQVEVAAAPSPWFLGDRFSALDIYVSAMTRWRPRRAWFAEHCPKLTSIALAADRRPGIDKVWQRNFGA